MSILLNERIIEENKLSIQEVLTLLCIYFKVNINEAQQSLFSKGLINNYYGNSLIPTDIILTHLGAKTISTIALDSDPKINNDSSVSRLERLVPLVQECFPIGKKEGTSQYWRGNKTDIKRKLQSFLLRYGANYEDERIINATKSYVQSFNGNYKFMRLLQYFIWKEEVKDGSKVTVSELANYLENEGQTDLHKDDWTSKLM